MWRCEQFFIAVFVSFCIGFQESYNCVAVVLNWNFVILCRSRRTQNFLKNSITPREEISPDWNVLLQPFQEGWLNMSTFLSGISGCRWTDSARLRWATKQRKDKKRIKLFRCTVHRKERLARRLLNSLLPWNSHAGREGKTHKGGETNIWLMRRIG